MNSQAVFNPDTFAIGAIFKDEKPYILEWIAFHRTLGIKQFIVADNDSTDGSTELLQLLGLAGIIHYIDFPSQPGIKPQLPCYSEILKIAKETGLEWVAFIDADEFLMPESETADFFSCIQHSTSSEDTGGVALNWAIYGSSHHEYRSNGLVLNDFIDRAPLGFSTNLHYKSIVRIEAAQGVSVNPHHFQLKEGYIYRTAQGHELVNDPQLGVGISDRVVSSPIRINHYIVKSKAEFLERKALKGSGTTEGRQKDEQYFQDNDRNDERDPCPAKRLHATLLEMQEISNRIGRIMKSHTAQRQQTTRSICSKLLQALQSSLRDRSDLPPEFDPLHYLLLNSDVLLAGVDPVQHYLDHGKIEGRPYRIAN